MLKQRNMEGEVDFEGKEAPFLDPLLVGCMPVALQSFRPPFGASFGAQFRPLVIITVPGCEDMLLSVLSSKMLLNSAYRLLRV